MRFSFEVWNWVALMVIDSLVFIEIVRNARCCCSQNAIEKLHQVEQSTKAEEAPSCGRNLQGNVFHLFYLSFLAAFAGHPWGLTTWLFMGTQVFAAQKVMSIT